MTKVYGSAPIKVAEIECDVDEMFFYQYLPVKMAFDDDEYEYKLPKRLKCFEDLIVACFNDFFNDLCSRNFDEYDKYYVYLTAKRLFVTEGSGLNRDGWHTDGFGSNDINYVWCDSIPMMYVVGEWDGIPNDHQESLKAFEAIGNSSPITWINTNTVYRLDDTVIHAQHKYYGNPCLRTFVKVSFSKEKYNLKGNSHNYLLDYDWEMKDRDVDRNHPTK